VIILSVKPFAEAFELVERYDEYRLIRSWGFILVFFAVIKLLGGLLFQPFWLDHPEYQQVWFLIALFVGYSFLLPIVIMVYFYVKTKKTTIEETELGFQPYIKFGLAMLSLWLVATYLPIFLPIISSGTWVAGLALIISSLLLREQRSTNVYRVQLIIGLILVLLTIPLVILEILSCDNCDFFSDVLHIFNALEEYYFKEFVKRNLRFASILISYSIYFFLGLYILKNASKTLEGSWSTP
jgi:hypothetical protein